MRLSADAEVVFVGDVHLGDGGRNDLFRGKDDLLVSYLRECAECCDAIVLMGDTFDLPQAFSSKRIARAHPLVCEELRSLARRSQLIFIRGNHDWFVDYAGLFPGAVSCEQLEVGGALVWHGHALDTTAHAGSAKYFASMTAHSMFERLARFEFRVPLHEFDSPQNRIMYWIGHRYAQRLQRRGRGRDFIAYWSREVWGDPSALWPQVTEFLHTSPYDTIVCGHSHLPGVVQLDGRRYVNAGSWTFAAAEVAHWDGSTFEVTDIATGRVHGDEAYRWMVDGHDPGDFFDWWAHHYRGWLRFGPPRSAQEVGERR